MSDKLKEHIECFHEHGVFIPTKTMRLVGDVDEDMFNSAICNLHSLDSTHGEITIKLMSDGGSLSVARGLYDAIRNLKNRVTIICYGEVSSAATIILQAADNRVMTTNSKIMLHSGVENIPEDHPRNVEKLYEQHRQDEIWIESIYLEKIKEKKKRFTRQKLREMITWDRFMLPKEAEEYGLIDKINEDQ